MTLGCRWAPIRNHITWWPNQSNLLEYLMQIMTKIKYYRNEIESAQNNFQVNGWMYRNHLLFNYSCSTLFWTLSTLLNNWWIFYIFAVKQFGCCSFSFNYLLNEYRENAAKRNDVPFGIEKSRFCAKRHHLIDFFFFTEYFRCFILYALSSFPLQEFSMKQKKKISIDKWNFNFLFTFLKRDKRSFIFQFIIPFFLNSVNVI